MFHVESRRRLVRRIPAEGLDSCGYGIDVFLFANRHLLVVCTQTCIFRCCISFEAVVCRLYEMLYPCICNVVISCWKSGAYGFVICRGGFDMCFVLGFGRKRPDPKQYRISGLTKFKWMKKRMKRKLAQRTPSMHIMSTWLLLQESF